MRSVRMARETCAAPALARQTIMRSPMTQAHSRATRIAMDVRPCPVIFATATREPSLSEPARQVTVQSGFQMLTVCYQLFRLEAV